MLTTERLILRPFTAGDAGAFLALAGHWDVARMTSDIPHPLTSGDARRWLEPAANEARFALTVAGEMVGGAGYFIQSSGAAELGFWLGRAHWGRGLATEAVKAVVAHGLEHDDAPAFTSAHFTDNPASGRVLAKLGFEPTGTARIHCIARGVDVAAICYHLPREVAAARLGIEAQPLRSAPQARSGPFSILLGRLSRSA